MAILIGPKHSDVDQAALDAVATFLNSRSVQLLLPAGPGGFYDVGTAIPFDVGGRIVLLAAAHNLEDCSRGRVSIARPGLYASLADRHRRRESTHQRA